MKRVLQAVTIAVGGLALVLLISALVFCSSLGLPEARYLSALSPTHACDVAATCGRQPRHVLSMEELRPLFSAFDAAEGTDHLPSQVARVTHCDFDENHLRFMFHEIRVAAYVQTHFTSDEKRTMLLNSYFFIEGADSVEAAAEILFHQPIAQLSNAQRALLVGLPRSPWRLSPFKHPDRAIARRNDVLDRMRAMGSLTDTETVAAKSEPILPSALQ